MPIDTDAKHELGCACSRVLDTGSGIRLHSFVSFNQKLQQGGNMPTEEPSATTPTTALDLIGSGLLCSDIMLSALQMAGIPIAAIPQVEPKSKALPMTTKPHARFEEAWQNNVPVEQLRKGDHVRHDALSYCRNVVSVKPHPKGGVQVKTVPAFNYRNRSANAAGKTLKAHLTGRCRRWDGKTMIEVNR